MEPLPPAQKIDCLSAQAQNLAVCACFRGPAALQVVLLLSLPIRLEHSMLYSGGTFALCPVVPPAFAVCNQFFEL